MSQPANDDYSQHLSDDEASYHEDASDNGTATNKPKQQQQQLTPTTTTISNIKLPILKKEEYDIWAMEMEHYLEYIDNDVWKVIQNGNSKKRISTGKDGVVRILPPVSAAEIHAVEKERKARTILLMAIPKEHLRRFHGMDDAKEIWEAIRTRFGGNANSKKMQKAVLKQQFEAFTISSSEGLEKGYDRFQQLLSQLEAHGAEVSTEDANHKFLRSLPPAWSNLAMTMRTKPEIDTLSIDDLYNNLRVFEQEIKEDSIGKPLYSRFTKTNDFKGVPHPLSGDYTPKPQEEIDESLYIYGKKGPQEPEPSISDDRSSEYSTCQSNNSTGSIGTSSEHSVDLESEISRVPQEVYVSKPITTNEKGVSAPKSKEVEPSCVTHIKTPRQPIKDQETHEVKGKNWNEMMERELCKGSVQLNAGWPNINSVRPNINTGRTNINSVRPNINIGRTNINSVRPNINTGRVNVNSVRPNVNTGRVNVNSVRPNVNTGRVNVNSVKSNVNTGRTNVNPVRPRVNTGSSNVNTVRSRQPVPTKTSNSFSPKRPQVNQLNQRRCFSKSHSPMSRPIVRNTARMTYSHAVKGNWGTAVKTSAGYNWRKTNLIASIS
ncbi:hypothetical protein Tco_0572469 [Tanacetum coccineum]